MPDHHVPAHDNARQEIGDEDLIPRHAAERRLREKPGDHIGAELEGHEHQEQPRENGRRACGLVNEPGDDYTNENERHIVEECIRQNVSGHGVGHRGRLAEYAD